MGVVTFHISAFSAIAWRLGNRGYAIPWQPYFEAGDLLPIGILIALAGAGLACTFSWRISGLLIIPFGVMVATQPIYSIFDMVRLFLPAPSPLVVWTASIAFACSTLYALGIIFGVSVKKGAVKGTAQWGKAKALRNTTSGFILGRWPRQGIMGKLFGDQLMRYPNDGHLITVAATRGGKGVGTIIPNLLDHPGSVVVSDPKGENWFVTSEWRRNMREGHKTIPLDPFGLTGVEGGAYNPMDSLDLESPGAQEMAMSMAENMVGPGEGQEAFWVNEAKAILVTFILYAKSSPDPSHHNLAHVRTLVSLELEEFGKLLEYMKEKSKIDAVIEGANRVMQKEPKELSGVLSTLQSRTHVFSSERLQETISSTTFTKEDILSDNVSVYVIVPVEHLVAYASWMRTTITSIYGLITRDAHKRTVKPKHRILFMLDEFANLGKIKEILEGFSIGAGFGISFWIILQDFSQLKEKYNDAWNSFVANADVIQVFAIQDQFSCDQVKGFMGETTVWQRKLNKKDDKSVQESVDEETRPLMSSDEIRRLHPDMQILFYRPHLPIQAKKIKFFQDPMFKDRAGDNPLRS